MHSFAPPCRSLSLSALFLPPACYSPAAFVPKTSPRAKALEFFRWLANAVDLEAYVAESFVVQKVPPIEDESRFAHGLENALVIVMFEFIPLCHHSNRMRSLSQRDKGISVWGDTGRGKGRLDRQSATPTT